VPETEGHSFGKDAINTLLKYMEDFRDQLVAIVAGCPKEMKRFLAANDGLASRGPFHPDVLDLQRRGNRADRKADRRAVLTVQRTGGRSSTETREWVVPRRDVCPTAVLLLWLEPVMSAIVCSPIIQDETPRHPAPCRRVWSVATRCRSLALSAQSPPGD